MSTYALSILWSYSPIIMAANKIPPILSSLKQQRSHIFSRSSSGEQFWVRASDEVAVTSQRLLHSHVWNWSAKTGRTENGLLQPLPCLYVIPPVSATT
jgi:hypothetical protein